LLSWRRDPLLPKLVSGEVEVCEARQDYNELGEGTNSFAKRP